MEEEEGFIQEGILLLKEAGKGLKQRLKMRGNITRIRRGSSTLPLECADTRYVISLMSADPMQSGRQRQEQNEVLDLYMACAGRGSYQRRGSTQG